MKVEFREITNNLSGNQKDLFKMIFANLRKELDTYFELFGDPDLFQYNERAFVGFLNNAIIRNDKSDSYFTLQEYCVKNNETKSTGRADFLICDKTNKECYLIEAKQNFTNEDADDKWEEENELNTKKYIDDILLQASKYIETKESYNNMSLFTCAMVFDSVMLTSNINKYLDKYKSTIENYFYVCYYLNGSKKNTVLNIYGIIQKRW